MIVEFTDTADEELEASGDYVALADSRRAKSFVQEVRERCASLSDYPSRFAIVPRYKRLGIRHFAHDSYVVFTGLRSSAS